MTTKHGADGRDLRLLISGNAVSALGNAVYLISVTLLLKELTESPIVLGIFQFLAISPGLLLSPFTGALIDRTSRRRIIVAADAWRGVLMIVAGTALFFPALRSAWLVLLVSLLAGVGHAAFVPAAQALLPSIVPAQRLQRATAMRASSSQVSNLAGNAAGGVLYALLGAPVLFVINGISFVVSALFETRITPDTREDISVSQDGLLHQARQGVRQLRTNRALLRMIISQAGLFALSPFLMLALPFIVIDELGLPQFVLGFYFAAALAGAIALFLSVRRLSSAQLLRIPLVPLGYAALAASFVLAALASSAGALIAVAVLSGAAAGAVYLTVTTWIQLRTPAEMHGRLFALLEAASAGVAPVSYLIAGAILEASGATYRWVVFLILSGLSLLWLILGALCSSGTTNPKNTF